MAKKALIVGINNYPGTVNDLPSCIDDAKNFEELISQKPFGFTAIKRLRDAKATVKAVEDGLKWLFKDAKSDDQLVFFYSGHGYTAAKNNVFEEYLCFYDGLFQDDRLSDLTQDLPDGIFTCIFDSCFSGGMEKLRFNIVDGERAKVKVWTPPRNVQERDEKAEKSATRYKSFAAKTTKTAGVTAKDFQVRSESDETGQLQLKGVLVCASQEIEPAAASTAKTNGMSAFTCCFLKALRNSSFDKPLVEVLKAATIELQSLGFSQTPVVKYPKAPAGINTRPFLSFTSASGTSTPTGAPEDAPRGTQLDVSGMSTIATIIATILAAQQKGYDSFIQQKETRMSVSDKGWEVAIPIAIEIVRAMTKDKGFSISGGAGASTPFGGVQGGGSVSFKGWEDAVPLAIEIVRAMTKDKGFSISGGAGASTPFGGVQGGGSVDSKGWEVAIPIAIEIVRAMRKDKGFSISGGAGASTPFGGVQGGGSVSFKGWEDAVPLAIEIVRAMTKDKGFSISGGAGASTPFGGVQGGGSVDSKGWEVAIPIAIEIVRAMSKN